MAFITGWAAYVFVSLLNIFLFQLTKLKDGEKKENKILYLTWKHFLAASNVSESAGFHFCVHKIQFSFAFFLYGSFGILFLHWCFPFFVGCFACHFYFITLTMDIAAWMSTENAGSHDFRRYLILESPNSMYSERCLRERLCLVKKIFSYYIHFVSKMWCWWRNSVLVLYFCQWKMKEISYFHFFYNSNCDICAEYEK